MPIRSLFRTLMVIVALLGNPASAAASPPGVRAQADEEPQPTEFYDAYIAPVGLRVVERQDEDLTGDGIAETVLLTVSGDCVSCDTMRLIVFSGKMPREDIPDLDAPIVAVDIGGPIRITQPIRLPDEPSCCPSGTYAVELWFDPSITQVDGIDVPGRFVFGPNVGLEYLADDPPPGPAPRHAVAAYYALLNAERYEQAYSLLAESFRQEAPYPSWLAEARLRGVRTLLEVAPVPQTSGRVRVLIEESHRASGAVTRRYGGVWQTVPIDDTGYAWRLGMFQEGAASEIPDPLRPWSHGLMPAVAPG